MQMGAMLCYDALVAPLAVHDTAGAAPVHPPARVHKTARQARKQAQQDSSGQQPQGRFPARIASQAPTAGATVDRGGATAGRGALRLKLLRSAAALAAVVLYVKARSWLAGDQVGSAYRRVGGASGSAASAAFARSGAKACVAVVPARLSAPPRPALQLVRIYRKVENPIAFSESRLERVLTAGYLHARYAWLLLAPLQLSGESPSLGRSRGSRRRHASCRPCRPAACGPSPPPLRCCLQRVPHVFGCTGVSRQDP